MGCQILSNRVKSAIPYFGGKARMVTLLLKFVPEHEVYVEVFGGAASLLMSKEPARVDVYNDIYGDVVNLFRVIRDPAMFNRFYHMVVFTMYSNEEYRDCRDHFRIVNDPVQRAYMWFVTMRQTFSAMPPGEKRSNAHWSFSKKSSSRGMAKCVSAWLSAVDRLQSIHERLQTVQIDHDDFRKVIPRYDDEGVFFYMDPPYVPSVRRGGEYAHEMSTDDHTKLVDMLLEITGKVVLSGYQNELYTRLEDHGWRRVDIPVKLHADANVGKTRGERVESLWLSPNHELNLIRKNAT